MRLRTQLFALCTGVLAIGCLTDAAVITIGPFPIDGSQEVPAVAASGSGTGFVTYDTTMHFHGAANPGQNAGVQLNIGAISGLVSPSVGKITIPVGQAADLQNGLWYVNLHTAANPGGELRGQVVSPPPACDGDANGDGVIDVNDISYVLFRLGNPCP
jgi:hypothetical protein